MASAIASPIIIEKKGKNSGRNVVIMVGVHGNERFGVDAVKELISNLKLKKGKVTLIVANPEAVKQNKRFLEYNLNRCFLKKQSKKIANTFEGKIAQKIIPFLNKTDWLLDIHGSNSSNSVPFVICEKQSFSVARRLAFGIVSYNWDKFQPGSSDYYMNLQNKVGICVECGYVNDFKSKKIAKEAVENFLSAAGLTDKKFPKRGKNRFFKIVSMYKNKFGKFKKSRNFRDFEGLDKKELIGIDGNRKVYCEEGDILLFVRNRENFWEECFLKAKETLLSSKRLDNLSEERIT